MQQWAKLLSEKKLSTEELKQLWDFLSHYITPRRKALFEERIADGTYHITVAVEDIYQERNASAVVRSAECFGVQSVHIIENHNEYKIAKGIAKGADKWVDLHLYDRKGQNNTEACLQALKARGYRLVATTPHQDDCYINELDLSQPTAFIMGGEKDGLTPTAMSMADAFVKIPIYGFTESFNISVATAIILYESTRRLHQSTDIAWQLDETTRLQKLVEWALKSVSDGSRLLMRFFEEQTNGIG